MSLILCHFFKSKSKKLYCEIITYWKKILAVNYNFKLLRFFKQLIYLFTVDHLSKRRSLLWTWAVTVLPVLHCTKVLNEKYPPSCSLCQIKIIFTFIKVLYVQWKCTNIIYIRNFIYKTARQGSWWRLSQTQFCRLRESVHIPSGTQHFSFSIFSCSASSSTTSQSGAGACWSNISVVSKAPAAAWNANLYSSSKGNSCRALFVQGWKIRKAWNQ